MEISNVFAFAMDADIESVRSNKRYDLIEKINSVGGRETGWFKMENTLILSVSYGVGCYRHIKISSNATLFELHKIILESFGFDDDHLHAFFNPACCPCRMGNRCQISSDRCLYFQQSFQNSESHAPDAG